jgi:hypothetical protein
MIIGISGKIGSGKDTVGSIIQYLTSTYRDLYSFIEWLDRVNNYHSNPHSDWKIKKIADKLKECVSLVTGIPRLELESMHVKNGLIGGAWGNLTYREMLQLLGTEVGRYIHPDFWVNALFTEYDNNFHVKKFSVRQGIKSPEYPNWIITDIRFPNELRAVKDRGGITIRLTRHTEVDPEIAKHRSETALDNAEFDYMIDNSGTIEELIEEVKSLNLLG